MYAITTITGRIGGLVARNLLASKQSVRAVVRDVNKGADWAKLGCEVAVADLRDAASLTSAFCGAKGVFILLPPVFDPQPGFPESRAIIAGVQSALAAARPPKVVCLSTIGAQARQSNLLSQLSLLEQALNEVPSIAFLRPGWFMENSAWDVAAAMNGGVIPSFLHPLDKQFPMVSAVDVAGIAAELLQRNWSRRHIVELEGPRRLSPNDIAATFSRILNRPVRMEVVPRETWGSLFRSQGMKNPTPRMQMLDGFNEGWIDFEGGETNSVKGKVELETVLKDLVEAARA